jgi:hypothetical protein
MDSTALRHYNCWPMDQPIFDTLMVPFRMIQVDTLIPISLNREKYGTHGILGTASGYASMRDL